MKYSILVLLLSMSIMVVAQTTPTDTSYWKNGGSFNLNFNRSTISDNWAAGGQDAISLSSMLKLFANKEKDKVAWSNSLDLAYGLAKIGESGFRKSDDQILLLSKYSYNFKKSWNFTALVDFRTQFAAGYTYTTDPENPGTEVETQISGFMAPAYLLTSIGFEYKKNNFFALISPLTGKSTFVIDEDFADDYGVDPGSNYRFELGALLKVGYKIELMENVEYTTNLNLFSAYETFGHIDVNWENVIIFKVNDYLSTTFTTMLIYDDDIDGEVQYKDVLNIGLLYKF